MMSLQRRAILLLLLLISGLARAADFYVDNPSAALRRASNEGRVLMIDFHATWCGPCKVMNRDVFQTRAFQQVSGNLVKLKLDVDKDTATELQTKFRVTSLPTLLFLRADGSVLDRMEGYSGADATLRRISRANDVVPARPAAPPEPAEPAPVAAPAESLPEIPMNEAEQTLRPRLAQLRAQLYASARKSKDRAQLRTQQIELLGRLNAATARGPLAVRDRLELAQLMDPRGEAASERVRLFTEANEEAERMVNEDRGIRYRDFNEADYFVLLGRARTGLDDTAGAATAFDRAAKLVAAQINAQNAAALTPKLLSTLEWAERSRGALSLSQDMQKRFPDDARYPLAEARIQFAQQDWAATNESAERAYKLARGPMRFLAASLRAQALISLGRGAEAAKLAKAALNAKDPAPPANPGTPDALSSTPEPWADAPPDYPGESPDQAIEQLERALAGAK